MGKNSILQGSLDVLLLKILSRQPGLHGYAIMTAISALSGDILRAEEGSLYPALHRLEQDGLVEGSWTVKDNGRRTRVYRLTSEGQAQLDTEQARWLSVTDAVRQVLENA